MQVHAPGADFAESGDDVDRRKGVANGVAERIAAAVAEGPEAESEFVLRFGPELVGHECVLSSL